jgi:hypothetical protein
MAMTERIKEDTVEKLCMIQVRTEEEIDEIRDQAGKTMFSVGAVTRSRQYGTPNQGKGWTQRPLSLRKREEVQEVLRSVRINGIYGKDDP